MKLRTGIKHLSLSLLCSRNSHIICPQFLDSISLTRTPCVWIPARVEWWWWWRPQYEVITAGICYSDFHQAHPINSVVNNRWSVPSADHRQVCNISEIRNCCYVNDRRYCYAAIIHWFRYHDPNADGWYTFDGSQSHNPYVWNQESDGKSSSVQYTLEY